MDFPLLFTSLLLLTMTVLPCVLPYNILISTLASMSHKIVFDEIAEELGKRGHQVTLLCSISSNKKVAGVKEVIVEAAHDELINTVAELGIYNEGKSGNGSPTLFTETYDSIAKIVNAVTKITNMTYNNKLVRDIIKNPRDASGAQPKYDLLIADGAKHDFSVPLAHLMGVPFVLVSSFGLSPFLAWSLNIPYPYAYLTNGLSATSGPKSFLERASNLISIIGLFYFRNVIYHPSIDQVLETYLPKMPSLRQLEQNTSFLLLNSHPAIHAVTPSMPYSAYVGCLHCKQAKPLPKELEDFMQSAGSHGVIYFSFGTIAQSGLMPEKLRDKFIEAFSRLPQKVIWKYKEDINSRNRSILDKVSNNVKLVSWAPQQDILGHPKTRIFLTHGGGLSMMEAAYHGVPLLGMPLMFDQFCNMAHAESRGFAVLVDVGSFTVDELVEKLLLVISEKRFKEKAAGLSKILTDYPIKPVELAAYHIEYVIRHQGAPHLKSGAEHLNIFQYFLLDVISTAVLIVFVVAAAICLVIRYSYHKLKQIFTKANKQKKTKWH